MIISEDFFKLSGKPAIETLDCKVTDSSALKRLIVSKTELRKGKSTRGHKHDMIEEVYIFTHGHGHMQVGEDILPFEHGDVIVIPEGKFHRVHASKKDDVGFLCVFETYER